MYRISLVPGVHGLAERTPGFSRLRMCEHFPEISETVLFWYSFAYGIRITVLFWYSFTYGIRITVLF